MDDQTDVKNDNCLAGVQCPDCGSQEPFLIRAHALVTAWDDGVSDSNGPQWDASSYIECQACGHDGTVGAFTRTAKPDTAPIILGDRKRWRRPSLLTVVYLVVCGLLLAGTIYCWAAADGLQPLPPAPMCCAPVPPQQ